MGFIPSGGSGGSLATSSDVALNSISNQHVMGYSSGSAKWSNRAATLSSSDATPGLVYFDDFFAGGSDSAKMTALNTWAGNHGGQPMPAVVFAARQYSFTTPIKLFSGLKLIGGPMSPSREFSRSTIFNWQGPTGSSMYIFPTEGQTNQSYPSDDSPRDITVSYIQMQGGSSTDCIEKHDPSSESYSGRVLWYCQFHGCGFKNFNTVWWGWGTGTSISGQTHFQSIGSTGLFLSGSENFIFGHDAFSFVANSNATMSDVPFMRTTMSKSRIGKCMVTARKASTCLSIEGGHNLVVSETAFDAQSSDPIYGAGVVISGGDGISIMNCSFKGMATNPSSGWDGAANNKGWIHVSGGSQISFMGNSFRREGNNQPATDYPLVYATSGVANNAVKWGFNGTSSFGGAVATIRQQVSGKIVAQTDPLVAVTVGA